MKNKLSAGILMYRLKGQAIEVFLVHPGGPFFAKKDEGYWSIPKGEPDNDQEEMIKTAIREFQEEVGIMPAGELTPLGAVVQKGGKTVHAWAYQTSIGGKVEVKSNLFELEWPPKSGLIKSFPEIDRGEFFTIDAAKEKIKQAQIPFIERLEDHLEKNSRI